MPSFTVSSLPGHADDLALDHATMPFAGKFGRRRTGTAVLTEADRVVAAVSFSDDRLDPTTCRIRHLAVARDEQGRGYAGALVDRFTRWATADRYDRIRITVLNPFAVTALARVGYGYDGETGPTGGVVLTYPASGASEPVEAAMARLASATLTGEQHRYVQRYLDETDTAATDG